MSMLWRSDHSAPELFVRSLMSSREALTSLAVQTVFAYIENTFFSSQWWDSLPRVDQEQVRSLAIMPNAYYTDFAYSNSILVQWKILEIKEPHS